MDRRQTANYKEGGILSKKRTVLLFGRTNAGKTAQVGELAGHVQKRTGKRTRLYTADRGGLDTIRPYIDLGIIEVVEMGDTDPWIWLNSAARGLVRDKQGKWVPGENSQIGMYAYEGLTSIADALMADMVVKAGKGVNIGGGANISFQVEGDGQTLKISGSNMAHFGVCQSRIKEEVWASQRLDAEFILWTAGASKDDDPEASGKVVGPAVVGKAMTAEVPRWFNLTLRIDCLPAQMGKPERHILYLGNHVDLNAGNATGLGNIRRPLDAPPLTTMQIEPASIVQAIDLIDKGAEVALEALRKRLSISTPLHTAASDNK